MNEIEFAIFLNNKGKMINTLSTYNLCLLPDYLSHCQIVTLSVSGLRTNLGKKREMIILGHF